MDYKRFKRLLSQVVVVGNKKKLYLEDQKNLNLKFIALQLKIK